MTYNLFGVVGPVDALIRIEHEQLRPVVPLADGLGVRPLDCAWLVDEADVHPNDIRAVCALVAAEIYEADADTSPIAYLAVEDYGSLTDEGAVVWHGGKVTYLHRVEDASVDASPVRDALALLGVAPGAAADPLETVGLRRFRTTEEWGYKGP